MAYYQNKRLCFCGINFCFTLFEITAVLAVEVAIHGLSCVSWAIETKPSNTNDACFLGYQSLRLTRFTCLLDYLKCQCFLRSMSRHEQGIIITTSYQGPCVSAKENNTAGKWPGFQPTEPESLRATWNGDRKIYIYILPESDRGSSIINFIIYSLYLLRYAGWTQSMQPQKTKISYACKGCFDCPQHTAAWEVVA
jgi:hypothetical protein